MNILFVPSWYATSNEPFKGSFFKEQAHALASIGHKIVILDASLSTRKNWVSKENFKLIKYNDGNIIIYKYTIPSLFIGRFPLVYNIFYGFIFKYILKKINKDGFIIDLVHAHSTYPAGYACIKYFTNNSIKVVVTEHSSIYNRIVKSRYLLHMLSKTIDKSNAFIAVSEYFKSNIIMNLQLNISDKIEIIPNMVNEIFKPQEKIYREKFMFLSIGNLVKNKRMNLLIKSFSIAFNRDMDVELIIIGDGPEKKELCSLINKMDLSQQVSIIPKLDRHGIRDKIIECDSFILLSENETFGLVYREALFVGRPIISSNNGGIVNDVNEENGIIVYSDSPEDVAIALKQVYENIDKYNFENISSSVYGKYSEEMFKKSIERVYQKVIDEVGDKV